MSRSTRITWGKVRAFILRSCTPEVISGKGILKIRKKFTGEQLHRSVISIKLLCNFIEIKLRYGCSLVNLLHIFRTPFSENTCKGLLLHFSLIISLSQQPQNSWIWFSTSRFGWLKNWQYKTKWSNYWNYKIREVFTNFWLQFFGNFLDLRSLQYQTIKWLMESFHWFLFMK